MKRFSEHINENGTSVTADVQPGNAYINTGVMNHLTPPSNIVAAIRNFFSPLLGVVASVAEDGFSVKLNSSKFTSQEGINSILYNTEVMRGTCLNNYIMQQGLTQIKIVPIGQYSIVYYLPGDIKNADGDGNGKNAKGKKPKAVKEMLEYDIDEVELSTIIKEDDDEQEIKKLDKDKVLEIINDKDKVKAAKTLEQFITSKIELPREYYFAGVKSKEGDESIALRWKFQKKRPHNKTTEVVRSIMNIFDNGKEGIWVQDFDKDGMVTLPDEVETLIKNILELIGASETNDPCVWSFEESEKKDDEKDDDKKEGGKVDGKPYKNDNDDSEDDDSRGDDDDDN